MKNGFCEYLLKRGRITEDQLERARSQVDILNLKTGLCSYAFGFMDPPEIQKIIGIQRRTGQKFGDIAIALGYLTPEQLHTILHIQEKYRLTLEDALLMDKALTREQLQEEQELFQQNQQKGLRVATATSARRSSRHGGT